VLPSVEASTYCLLLGTAVMVGSRSLSTRPAVSLR
jgi:hypothetical protein